MPLFHDILKPLEGAKELGFYGNGYYAGKAAVTEKQIGKGRVIHFGSVFARSNVKTLLEYTGIAEPFREYIEAPETVEVVMRRKKDRQFMFVLNFQAQKVFYRLKRQARMLYSGEILSGECVLPAYGTAVYEIL